VPQVLLPTRLLPGHLTPGILPTWLPANRDLYYSLNPHPPKGYHTSLPISQGMQLMLVSLNLNTHAMKKFTSLIILSCLALLFLIPVNALGQTTQLDPQECFFISDDECFAVGYVSVTPSLNQPGGPQNAQLDVEIFFQDVCDVVEEITINQVQGPPIRIFDAEITAQIQTVAFQVNANSFNDGTLRVTIHLGGNDRLVVPIVFDESFDCGIIDPLPVELTSFEGKATESGISLEWETASEINNSHFDVERSADGNKFESISRINGHGSTSVTSSYSLTDKAPLKGLNYYRLKQVDFDNTTSYSKTIVVKWEVGDAMKVVLVPNPCRNGNCNISISNAANTETLVQLKDMAGRILYSKTIKSDSHLLELPADELKRHKGLFFLTATTGKQVVHSRIVLE